MILLKKDILQDSITVGPKTKNLKRLVDLGFLVPDFIAIPNNIIEIINNNNSELKKLCQIIISKFPQTKYIVRSSALIEDQDNSSMAGQFHTEINISNLNLENAIKKVINQAKTLLKNDLRKLSIIVQKYIEADYAGVCFTRNSNGQREIMFEYHKGIGEDIVGGKIIPKNATFYWSENKKICGFSIDIFKNIENKFSFPQDIEWCIKDEKIYILQTRPITTISKNEYETIIFLEKNLNHQKNFYFEKSEISEVAPRPTPFTLSLLQKIFGENGPVSNVYKKHKINYYTKDILKIIGNELYIDRNLEIKSLLPSFNLLNENYKCRLSTLNSLGKTLKNIFYISTLKENKAVFNNLEELLNSDIQENDFGELINIFLNQYETILEINLFAGKYFKKLEVQLKKEPINISDIFKIDLKDLSNQENVFKYDNKFKTIGNSLEISDETEFYNKKSGYKNNITYTNWWNTLTEFKKSLYKNTILKALIYQRYREYTRILMIKNLTLIRESILQKSGFSEKRNIYFHTIDEIKNNKLDEKKCIERKKEYEKYNNYSLPNKLTLNYINDKKENLGISAGIVQGILLEEKNIELSNEKNTILYTKILSPELIKYFPKIKGIVSENGGYLSHLSIVARESDIPVVISYNQKNFKIGDYIEIDGSNGKTTKIIQ